MSYKEELAKLDAEYERKKAELQRTDKGQPGVAPFQRLWFFILLAVVIYFVARMAWPALVWLMS